MIQFAYLVLLIAPLVGMLFIGLGRSKVQYVASFVVFGWLLLPIVSTKLTQGIPVYDKAFAVGLGVLLGMLAGKPNALLSVRPSWIDLPMIAWCLVPIASSLSNNLGLYDGLSAAFRQTVIWGTPYLVGRTLFGNYEGLFELARKLFIGAVVYFPFILCESRLSPRLHLWIYGVGGRGGYETAHFFGPLKYKPSVFLQSTLELTPLMGAAALSGWWLWKKGRLGRVMDIPTKWLVAAASCSWILGKSLGGFGLTIIGGVVLLLSMKYQRKVFLGALLMISPIYLFSRSTGMWSGQNAIDFLNEYVSERRAQSFNTRLVNEDQLFAKAIERPYFGWGGWGRNRVYNDNGKDVSRTDGMWVIAIGEHGLVGLASLYGSLLLPVAMMLWRTNARVLWNEPAAAGVFILMVVVTLHSIDCLANAMSNPVYFMAAGGLTALLQARKQPTNVINRIGTYRPRRTKAASFNSV